MATDKSVAERTTFGGKPMQEFPYRIGILLSSYSQAINKQNKTTGSLFQQKTKAKILIEKKGEHYENYLVNCFHYLHRNPLDSGLVKDLSHWVYSSYQDYAGLRKGTLCNIDLFFSLTGLSSKEVLATGQVKFENDLVKKFFRV